VPTGIPVGSCGIGIGMVTPPELLAPSVSPAQASPK
jgi:hypothetical protein